MTQTEAPSIESSVAFLMLLILFVPLLQPSPKLSETVPLAGVIERMVASAMEWEQQHGRWEGA